MYQKQAFAYLLVILTLMFHSVSGAVDDRIIIGLITKTESNPFFVNLKEAAIHAATEMGVELRSYTGDSGEDVHGQISAIKELTEIGAKGFLITPANPASIVVEVLAARNAGLMVIALDTPFDSADFVDATFATDNFRAGELIGKWARATSDRSKLDANLALLNLSEEQISVDVQRNQGFLHGFGIDIRNKSQMFDETDNRIIASASALGTQEGGRNAMTKLINKNPDINVVYTINEPAAVGAYEALKDAGKENEILIVSIDGGCDGIRKVAAGMIGATAMQFPSKMASLGIEAIVEFVKSGKKPNVSPDVEFFDTGVILVTDDPASGIPSISTEEAMKYCWE